MGVNIFLAYVLFVGNVVSCTKLKVTVGIIDISESSPLTLSGVMNYSFEFNCDEGSEEAIKLTIGGSPAFAFSMDTMITTATDKFKEYFKNTDTYQKRLAELKTGQISVIRCELDGKLLKNVSRGQVCYRLEKRGEEEAGLPDSAIAGLHSTEITASPKLHIMESKITYMYFTYKN